MLYDSSLRSELLNRYEWTVVNSPTKEHVASSPEVALAKSPQTLRRLGLDVSSPKTIAASSPLLATSPIEMLARQSMLTRHLLLRHLDGDFGKVMARTEC